MPTQSPLPVDLLNVLGSFIGDKFHSLTFSLTPDGNLATPRILMQCRGPRFIGRPFHYAGTMNMCLHVEYPDTCYAGVNFSYENRLERLEAYLDFTIRTPEETAYIEQEIEQEKQNELAKKFALNIGRLSLRNRVNNIRLLGAAAIVDN